MNWRRGKNNSPPGTGGGARRAGVVVKSKLFSLIPMNEWGGELFDPSTTPALRATPPVPGGELFLPLLQFIHTFIAPLQAYGMTAFPSNTKVYMRGCAATPPRAAWPVPPRNETYCRPSSS